MSGKSTLLKAVGVNVVLAQVGGPVSASQFRLPQVALYTSMRAQDSLEQGVSQFMAQLKRLKHIIDAARYAQADDITLLYLLDEILQGTNAAERQIAVRRILHHLLRQRAIGMISSHDLALADTDALSPVTKRVHFSERIRRSTDGPQLSFDYKLRPGVATSTNALKLMEIVGLGDECC
jgi:DNA mismatch repair ATPase MutS